LRRKKKNRGLNRSWIQPRGRELRRKAEKKKKTEGCEKKKGERKRKRKKEGRKNIVV
jgi:hypothetical protein